MPTSRVGWNLKKSNPHSIHAASSAHRLGFTMIELMVTLVIMALVAGLIMPSAVSAMRRNNVQSHGEKVLELLQFAQRYAVTSHHPVQVNIDSGKNTCWASVMQTKLPWLEQVQESNTRQLKMLVVPPEYQLSMQSQDSQSTSSAAWDTITFKSDGRSDDTIIRLSDERGIAYEIIVFGSNGSIEQKKQDF